VYALFKDAVSSADNRESNRGIISEKLIGEDVEEIDRSLI
jgi:hypothetical protein